MQGNGDKLLSLPILVALFTLFSITGYRYLLSQLFVSSISRLNMENLELEKMSENEETETKQDVRIEKKKKQQRQLGGVRTMPFILGEPTS